LPLTFRPDTALANLQRFGQGVRRIVPVEDRLFEFVLEYRGYLAVQVMYE